MTDQNTADGDRIRRDLRIQRAAIGAVLHGYARDNEGFNAAVADLVDHEGASLQECASALWWALSRLPHGMEAPTELRDQLSVLYSIPGPT